MNRHMPREYTFSETVFHKSSQYYEYKNLSSKILLPENIKNRVNSLVRYAVDNGMLQYIAYISAVKYVLEHEYPEYLLLINVHEPPLRGYSKCLRIWSELGVIHNMPRKMVLMRVVNSREFEDRLVSEGVPTSLLNTVKQRIMEHIDRGKVPKGNLRRSVKSLMDMALELGGEIHV